MKYALYLLLLCGCSQLPSPPISETSKEVPEWVYSPYDSCHEAEELCATGEGRSFAQADTQAKVNLASIFEVKVESTFNAHSSSRSSGASEGQVRQEVQHSLQESVNQILETVQIKKHFKKDGLTYALASLDRHKASELLGERLYRLDKEMEILWAARQRTNLRKMIKLSLEREKLYEKFSIVANSPRPAPVAYQDVIEWRESRPKLEPLALKTGSVPAWMKEKIEELITESGFRLVKGKADKVVSMNVTSIREHLNVKGFEKYTFTLKLTHIENGRKKKVISTSETVTGRSQADALLKVKTFFNDYLEQNLSALHLD
jgi:hypothetical protein